jgi:hypothetical protein
MMNVAAVCFWTKHVQIESNDVEQGPQMSQVILGKKFGPPDI